MQQRKMDSLLESLSASQTQNPELNIQFNPDIKLPSFPMTSVKEVADMDMQLNTDELFLNQMVVCCLCLYLFVIKKLSKFGFAIGSTYERHWSHERRIL